MYGQPVLVEAEPSSASSAASSVSSLLGYPTQHPPSLGASSEALQRLQKKQLQQNPSYNAGVVRQSQQPTPFQQSQMHQQRHRGGVSSGVGVVGDVVAGRAAATGASSDSAAAVHELLTGGTAAYAPHAQQYQSSSSSHSRSFNDKTIHSGATQQGFARLVPSHEQARVAGAGASLATQHAARPTAAPGHGLATAAPPAPSHGLLVTSQNPLASFFDANTELDDSMWGGGGLAGLLDSFDDDVLLGLR
jgi:hypothetical protein